MSIAACILVIGDRWGGPPAGILVQRVLVTSDLPSWDLQLRSDPPSYALGATTKLLHVLHGGVNMPPDEIQTSVVRYKIRLRYNSRAVGS